MYTATEQQILISTYLLNKNRKESTIEAMEKFGSIYFCSFKKNWQSALKNLVDSGTLIRTGNDYSLNQTIDILPMLQKIANNANRY